jgi:hypothetical protein
MSLSSAAASAAMGLDMCSHTRSSASDSSSSAASAAVATGAYVTSVRRSTRLKNPRPNCLRAHDAGLACSFAAAALLVLTLTVSALVDRLLAQMMKWTPWRGVPRLRLRRSWEAYERCPCHWWNRASG